MLANGSTLLLLLENIMKRTKQSIGTKNSNYFSLRIHKHGDVKVKVLLRSKVSSELV